MQTTFKKGHKFDFLDMFTISPREVQELFWEEFWSKVDKKKPNLDNLKVILDSGLVDLEAKDYWDRTPLHYAAERNSLAVAQLLISSGADLEAKDDEGYTPLHVVALWWDHPAVVKLLISSGAKVNEKDKWGQTPLHVVALWWDHPAVVKLLISSGADLEAKDKWGRTPLHKVVCNNKLEVAKLLFKHSSKKNRKSVLNKFRNVNGCKTLVKSLEKLKV